MRSLWLGVFVCAVMLVACGDDDSDFATRPSDGSSLSSSSAKSNSSTKSSSSSEYTRVPCDVETDENCFKDDRDGQTYRTVQIGSQVWMAENLNYETDFSSCYKNVESNCAKYGRLYRWAAAVGKSESECGYGKICSLPSGNIQGVCPSGWHLPDTTEWYALFSAVGGQRVAGTKLKSTSGWYSSGNGTDAFSFSALPAGYRGGSYGIYNNVTYNAEFWSSTEHDSDRACKVSLDYDIDIAHLYCSNKDNEYSVRCLKDYDDESSSSVTPKSSDSETSVSSSSTNSSSSSAKSSSSVKNESSSSVTLSSSSSDISAVEESSSSEDSSNSSSSDSEESSSSAGEAASSSSSVELNCSALLEDEFGWDWNIPKECRFNPNITYGTMTDSRDKKVYKTIKIGGQTWMVENLNYFDKTLNDRSWCFGASDSTTTANCAVAGRLYTWAAAIDSVKLATDADNPQDCGFRKTCTLPDTVYGICPPGWHLPTQVEWKTLLTEVGGQSIAGKILKSQTGWYDNGNGTDDVGFSALPAGGRDAGNGDFYAGGRLANFWSASEDDSHTAYHMSLSYEDEHANLIGYQKNYGFSVRCVKDDP